MKWINWRWTLIAFLLGTLLGVIWAGLSHAQEYLQYPPYIGCKMVYDPVTGERYRVCSPNAVPRPPRRDYVEPFDRRCPSPEVACRVGDRVCCNRYLRER